MTLDLDALGATLARVLRIARETTGMTPDTLTLSTLLADALARGGFVVLVEPRRLLEHLHQSRGRFIRRYLPVLANLPDALIHAPWLARPVDLAAAGIQIGVDYPAPVVDHASARQETLARFAAARSGHNGG